MVTPSDPDQRGCCLALRLSCSGDEVCKRMLERGIAVCEEMMLNIASYSSYVFMCLGQDLHCLQVMYVRTNKELIYSVNGTSLITSLLTRFTVFVSKVFSHSNVMWLWPHFHQNFIHQIFLMPICQYFVKNLLILNSNFLPLFTGQ